MSTEHRYTFIESLQGSQVTDLHQLYQNEWWSKERSLDDVNQVLAHSTLVFGACDSRTGQLVAFTRVLSDRIFKAILFDVIVHPDHRGSGLGTQLLQQVLKHPVIQQVRHVELYCLPERFRFYQDLGFTEELGPLKLMRKTQR